MIHSDKIADVLQRPDLRGRCFTGLEIIGAIGAATSLAGIGMSIAGASQQSDAQRQAGEIAYQNALIRNQQMQAEAKRLENEAKQRDDNANAQQAASQRQAIEEKRKATLVASRARAVMAASGAGVDNNLIDGIMGEGDFAFDTALYEGDSKAQDIRYQADLNRHEAATRRWQGETEVAAGGRTRSAMNTRADNTMTMGITKGVIGGLSIASKYGGDLLKSGVDAPGRTDFGSEFDL